MDILKKRALAKSVVAVSIYVGTERTRANGIVELACRVSEQRGHTACGVLRAGSVAREGSIANGRIVICGVVIERNDANPYIACAGRVFEKRIGTIGHVVAGSVIVERVIASSGVADPADVVVKRS